MPFEGNDRNWRPKGGEWTPSKWPRVSLWRKTLWPREEAGKCLCLLWPFSGRQCLAPEVAPTGLQSPKINRTIGSMRGLKRITWHRIQMRHLRWHLSAWNSKVKPTQGVNHKYCVCHITKKSNCFYRSAFHSWKVGHMHKHSTITKRMKKKHLLLVSVHVLH